MTDRLNRNLTISHGERIHNPKNKSEKIKILKEMQEEIKTELIKILDNK